MTIPLAPDWLRQHCGNAEYCVEPFNARLDGERYAAATDGYHLVALRGQRVPRRQGAPPNVVVAPLLRPLSRSRIVRLADLQRWTDKHVSSLRRPPSPILCGRVFGLTLDLKLLHRALLHVRSECARVAVCKRGRWLQVRGENWIVVVMGLSHDRGTRRQFPKAKRA
jgi:hypothetical protein